MQYATPQSSAGINFTNVSRVGLIDNFGNLYSQGYATTASENGLKFTNTGTGLGATICGSGNFSSQLYVIGASDFLGVPANLTGGLTISNSANGSVFHISSTGIARMSCGLHEYTAW